MTAVPQRLADENPADELQGGHLIDVLHTALQHVTQPASAVYRTKDVRIEKVGRWILAHLVYLDQQGVKHHVTVRMVRAQAQVLAGHLTRALR
jgi:hypothetical protein